MKAKTVDLSAGVVSTVTLTADSGASFESLLVKHDGADNVYYRIDGVDPTVKGDDCQRCLDAPEAFVPIQFWSGSRVSVIEVRLISAGAPTVTVEAD